MKNNKDKFSFNKYIGCFVKSNNIIIKVNNVFDGTIEQVKKMLEFTKCSTDIYGSHPTILLGIDIISNSPAFIKVAECGIPTSNIETATIEQIRDYLNTFIKIDTAELLTLNKLVKRTENRIESCKKLIQNIADGETL